MLSTDDVTVHDVSFLLYKLLIHSDGMLKVIAAVCQKTALNFKSKLHDLAMKFQEGFL